MIKALIFDFYGVIYSNLDWEIINQRIYSDEKKKEEFRKLIQSANMGQVSNADFLSRTSELAEDTLHPQKPALNPVPSVNYSALGLIERLKRSYRIGLLSNGGRSNIDEALSAVGGANKYFYIVLSSSDTMHIKPAKEAFLGMIEKLGSTIDNTLVIDDSPRHIQGAKNIGLKTIRFSDMEQLRVELQKFGVQ